MGSFVLIAVLTMQEGVIRSKAGYQSSVMQRFETMHQCELAARELLEVYRAGSFDPTYRKGEVRCVELGGEKKTILSF